MGMGRPSGGWKSRVLGRGRPTGRGLGPIAFVERREKVEGEGRGVDVGDKEGFVVPGIKEILMKRVYDREDRLISRSD